jgi:pimeloyl-ACP methyl ester carboxylesterase
MSARSQDTTLADRADLPSSGAPVIFLPGIIMPAALRYAPLIEALGDSARATTKELEVYGSESPPPGYAIEHEVEGISRAADAAGLDRFHLYGHSAGGACALAYVATHPERILSLALDEPASDFSAEDQSELRKGLAGIAELPAAERMQAFLRFNLAPGVDPPAPPTGPAPPWMSSRPGGIEAFGGAMLRHRLATERLRGFDRPVYYSHGSLSHPRWAAMPERLASVFPDFTAELYEGIHHLQTSHQREPARVAVALRRLWSRAA